MIFLTFLGRAIKVVKWGLDPVGWLISIAIGSTSLLISVILKLIPLEKYLPGGGATELDHKALDKASTLNLRKKHDSNFYR